MKKIRKTLLTALLALMLVSVSSLTFTIGKVNADDNNFSKAICKPYGDGWYRIKTDLITILFPAGGRKPMFLWWYSNDTNNIYVVKYKGLIEYLAIDFPYYLHRYQANKMTLKERLEARYSSMHKFKPHINRMKETIENFLMKVLEPHPPFLPFSACQWNLTGPVNITRSDGVSYIAFNFTLARAPPNFKFAENNVIIRCRFYRTSTTENVHGLYNYTANAGELKMDFIVKKWEWNIDRVNELFNILQKEFNVSVPKTRAGLALWVDLASINITDLPLIQQNVNSPRDLVEAYSKASDIIIGNKRVHVLEDVTGKNVDETPIPIRGPMHKRCRLHFARESQTLAGFFDFVDTAIVTNVTSGESQTVNVTATYISAGGHMRLFIGYPYFGNRSLEHDPSIGVEEVPMWLPNNLLIGLIVATIIIGVAILAVKIRKKTVNIVNGS